MSMNKIGVTAPDIESILSGRQKTAGDTEESVFQPVGEDTMSKLAQLRREAGKTRSPSMPTFSQDQVSKSGQ